MVEERDVGADDSMVLALMLNRVSAPGGLKRCAWTNQLWNEAGGIIEFLYV